MKFRSAEENVPRAWLFGYVYARILSEIVVNFFFELLF